VKIPTGPRRFAQKSHFGQFDPKHRKWAKCGNQPPNRKSNQASRTREYLTADEVERIAVAARRAGGRVANRDALLIVMAYRHGFRASG
jgi:integrase